MEVGGISTSLGQTMAENKSIKNKIIVCNWKMNGNIDLANEFCSLVGYNSRIIFALPNIFICKYSNKLCLAAQDCSVFDGYGAKTGEISSKMLRDNGVKYVILGHSERRIQCEESQTKIHQKIINACGAGLKTILCVSEEYMGQINEDISKLLKQNKDSILIAYEPLTAIGTGVIPDSGEIDSICGDIKEMYDTQVIYGGSVNSANAKEILSLKNVDGVLIGGASLDAHQIVDIAKIAELIN